MATIRIACNLLWACGPGSSSMTDAPSELIARRGRHMGAAYSHFYEKPLHLVKGEGVWLYDSEGRRYLDCYNNVPSVGHCHPEVVEALARQAGTLNTHTRYLHHEVIDYAQELAATLPGDLSVCTFVCTGTEANDLAYRMAAAVTGHEGIIITSHAYHGNSWLVSQLSQGFGSQAARADFIVDVEPPYTYRGPFAADHPDVKGAYAGLVDDAIETLRERGKAPAMMLIDSIYDAKAILTPEPAYLQQVYRKVRAAGGLLVADEVQSGLTRLGDNFWGFMDSGVVPDIVTMGKPMGDGHPLAVVVTTPAIAQAFAESSGYFNTFGGNPVSAVVGRTVLNIVQRDRLIDRVKRSGDCLTRGLLELQQRYEGIAEVRGKGLFMGVELVHDRASAEPAPERAVAVVEKLREEGVLASTNGVHGNVLKLRPPLVFETEHAELALAAIDKAMAATEGRQ